MRASIERNAMLCIVFIMMSVACGSSESRPSLGPVATLTPTANTIASDAIPDRSVGAPGPYSTLESAEAYVKAQQDVLALCLVDPRTTWRPSGVLHTIHATPGTGANWGGDNYFFFVNGNLVSRLRGS